jgi:hypothetical protein
MMANRGSHRLWAGVLWEMTVGRGYFEIPVVRMTSTKTPAMMDCEAFHGFCRLFL